VLGSPGERTGRGGVREWANWAGLEGGSLERKPKVRLFDCFGLQ